MPTMHNRQRDMQTIERALLGHVAHTDEERAKVRELLGIGPLTEAELDAHQADRLPPPWPAGRQAGDDDLAAAKACAIGLVLSLLLWALGLTIILIGLLP